MSGLETSMMKARHAEKRGDFAEAERLYGAVLERFPRNVRARKGLDAAFRSRAQAPAEGPPQAALELLVGHYRAGRLPEAVGMAEALLVAHPAAAAVHNLLGAAHLSMGGHAQAEAALRRALAQGARMPAIFNNLGMAIADQGRPQESVAFYREAIALDPDHAIAHNNLGNALKAMGLFEDALAAYRRAIAIDPAYADAFNNQGLAQELLGRYPEAIASFNHALALKPDHAAAHNNLGNIHTTLGDLGAARRSYERAIAIVPNYPEALYNLGNIHKREGRTAEARVAYERARDARPGYADAWVEHGKALALEGRLDEAIGAFTGALEAEPEHMGALAHRLYYQAHVCDWSTLNDRGRIDARADSAFSPFAALTFADDPEAGLRRARAWAGRAFPRARRVSLPSPAPASDGRIRIGYFSADFHDHATLYLMAGLFREHDRSRFAIHAFSYGQAAEGGMRQQIIATTDSFTDVRSLSDAEIAEVARARGLDIAVDLKGYTQNTRMPIFAQRLAPVQIGYLGYPGTSGVDFIDYFVADEVTVPEAERRHFSEQLILLPDCYQPNDDRRPIADTARTRSDCGLPEEAVVFCCFNQSYKIGPREFDIWMRLLARVEGSVLWLLRTNEWAEANLKAEAAARGVSPDRLVFAPPLDHSDHLARLAHADLFLDTFHVNAHTTASDALWAGVPLVTLAGRQFAARVSASLLGAVGLPELVTGCEDEYESLALDLAQNPGRLSAVRTRLAANRMTCPLFDTARYTAGLEAAFAAAHALHVSGQPPRTFAI